MDRLESYIEGNAEQVGFRKKYFTVLRLTNPYLMDLRIISSTCKM